MYSSIKSGDSIWELTTSNKPWASINLSNTFASCRINLVNLEDVTLFAPKGKSVDVLISSSSNYLKIPLLAEKYLINTIIINSFINNDIDFTNVRAFFQSSLSFASSSTTSSSFIIEAYQNITDPLQSYIVARRPNPTCPNLEFLDLTESCLNNKLNDIKTTFAAFLPQRKKLEVINSPTFASRLRVRFGLQRSTEDKGPLTYFVFDKKNITKNITTFPIAATSIQRLMPLLITALNHDLYTNQVLSNGVRACHFRGTLQGDMLITLIYDRKIEDETKWRDAAHAMELGDWIDVMGRSKGQVVSTSEKRYVQETLRTKDGRSLQYRQPEGSFSNPNGRINEKCLDWLCDVLKSVEFNSDSKECNLLELYCGSGNHTMALAAEFNHIVAVELDQKLVDAANYNATLNNVTNTTFVRLHSDKFCKKVLFKKEYKGIEFHAVLVDPPRCGLDPITLSCVSKYDHVLYISCNPVPLLRDLKVLCKTHEVIRFAVMDQFAGTSHLECGVYCRIKKVYT